MFVSTLAGSENYFVASKSLFRVRSEFMVSASFAKARLTLAVEIPRAFSSRAFRNEQPSVVFFGDNIPRPRVEETFRMVDDSSLLIAAGSSLHVGLFSSLSCCSVIWACMTYHLLGQRLCVV